MQAAVRSQQMRRIGRNTVDLILPWGILSFPKERTVLPNGEEVGQARTRVRCAARTSEGGAAATLPGPPEVRGGLLRRSERERERGGPDGGLLDHVGALPVGAPVASGGGAGGDCGVDGPLRRHEY